MLSDRYRRCTRSFSNFSRTTSAVGRRSSSLSSLTSVLGIFAMAAAGGAAAQDAAQWLSPDALPADFYTFTPDEFWREPRDSYWMSFSNWVIGQEHDQ